MILKKILLRNFRNYEMQVITFNEKFNFIYGNNGQGKTNILEGISYTTFGKSFLGSAETDCIKFGSNEFCIEADFENDLRYIDQIIINYNLITKSKSIHRNKEKVSAFSSELFGKIPLVFLSPKSLTITYGNPSDRRKFFDILISQSSRLYLDYLKDLAKLLKQKNALLRNYSLYRKYSFNEVKNMMFSYNEKLIEVSANIIYKRLNFLLDFKSFFQKNFSFLSVPNQSGFINYYSEVFGEVDNENQAYDLTVIRKNLEKFIYGKFEEEISRAITLAGPQRDDYIFKLNKNNDSVFELKNFASQGEHKTFLVALKLSEYDYLKDKRATNPILLLDDVLSELDEGRVSKIISHLKEFGQIFLTTTDINYLQNLGEFYMDDEISVFKIENGSIIN